MMDRNNSYITSLKTGRGANPNQNTEAEWQAAFQIANILKSVRGRKARTKVLRVAAEFCDVVVEKNTTYQQQPKMVVANAVPSWKQNTVPRPKPQMVKVKAKAQPPPKPGYKSTPEYQDLKGNWDAIVTQLKNVPADPSLLLARKKDCEAEMKAFADSWRKANANVDRNNQTERYFQDGAKRRLVNTDGGGIVNNTPFIVRSGTEGTSDPTIPMASSLPLPATLEKGAADMSWESVQ